MPVKGTKKRGRKKVRFSAVTIKLTARQKKSLVNFCRYRHTTPNKLIKRSIRPVLENYSTLEFEDKKREMATQLALF